ncbi:hypothetical protein DFH06DRAFT_1134696 [Mycena polygramma]|nr:hypothetical protein DFH06DRAFT_1134696 [Mycena polygramma]
MSAQLNVHLAVPPLPPFPAADPPVSVSEPEQSADAASKSDDGSLSSAELPELEEYTPSSSPEPAGEIQHPERARFGSGHTDRLDICYYSDIDAEMPDLQEVSPPSSSEPDIDPSEVPLSYHEDGPVARQQHTAGNAHLTRDTTAREEWITFPAGLPFNLVNFCVCGSKWVTGVFSSGGTLLPPTSIMFATRDILLISVWISFVQDGFFPPHSWQLVAAFTGEKVRISLQFCTRISSSKTHPALLGSLAGVPEVLVPSLLSRGGGTVIRDIDSSPLESRAGVPEVLAPSPLRRVGGAVVRDTESSSMQSVPRPLQLKDSQQTYPQFAETPRLKRAAAIVVCDPQITSTFRHILQLQDSRQTCPQVAGASRPKRVAAVAVCDLQITEYSDLPQLQDSQKTHPEVARAPRPKRVAAVAVCDRQIAEYSDLPQLQDSQKTHPEVARAPRPKRVAAVVAQDH